MTYDTKPLTQGSSGRAVTFLQARLGVPTTGTFDAVTRAALMSAQTHANLTADGVYGPITNGAMTRHGPTAFASIAQALRVEPQALAAVVSVETSGAGFYANGLPKILLERHYVYQLATLEQRSRLPAGVCNLDAGGYAGGVAEWDRFELVAAVDLGLAIQSCSWGLGQLMGANWKLLGYRTPQAFMMAMADTEDAQLMAMGQFIQANPGMRTALSICDWAAFARAYNGPNYALGRYDAKLAFAYDQSA